MKNRFKSLINEDNHYKWSTSNLQTKESVFRVNWSVYDEVIKARAILGVVEMQNLRQNQMFTQYEKKLVNSVWVNP